MLAAFIAACCAANGVPLRDPRKPSDPELFHASTLPLVSEMVTIVLLKEAWTCTSPCGTCFRSFFLNVFFLPFFSGAAGAPAAAAAGFAIAEFSVLSSQFSVDPFSKTENWEPGTENWFLSFCRRLLLLCDRSFAWTLPRTGVSMRALSAYGQVATMPEPAVRTDFDEPLDVHRNVLAQIAFHRAFRFDDLPDAVDFVFRQILHLFHRVNFRFVQNARRARVPDPVDVCERDINVFITRKMDAGKTSNSPSLALTLLVLRILADHPHHTLAVDDLALIANFFDRCSNFHKPAFSLQPSAVS